MGGGLSRAGCVMRTDGGLCVAVKNRNVREGVLNAVEGYRSCARETCTDDLTVVPGFGEDDRASVVP